jgi:hypothetical protein
MKVTKKWNNVSEQLLKDLDLDNSGTIRVRLENIKYVNGMPRVPRIKAIPAVDRIFDPYTKEYVSIANIGQINADGSEVIENIFYDANHKGIRTFDPKKQKDRELLEFLLLSDHCGSKEDRDKSKEAIYHVYKPEVIAEATIDKDLGMAEAMGIVGRMSNTELIAFASTKGWDSREDIRLIKQRMLTWIKRDHEDFMKFADPHTMRVNTVLRKAEVEGMVKFDTVANAWIWSASGEVIKQFRRSKNFDRYKSYIEWMKESDEANEVLDTLEQSTGLSKKTATVKKQAPKAEIVDIEAPVAEVVDDQIMGGIPETYGEMKDLVAVLGLEVADQKKATLVAALEKYYGLEPSK